MNEIETNYGVIMNQIEGGNIDQLSNHDFGNIVWFLSFLYARNLPRVSRYSEISEGLLDFIGNSLLAYNLQKESLEYLRPYLKVKTKPEYIQKTAMYSMFAFARRMYSLLTSDGEWFFLNLNLTRSL